MKIGILNIGDELLAGKILNTNQLELARMLRPLGHDVLYGLVIGDEPGQIAAILESALGAARRLPQVDYLILTGGLGPTQDDLTRQSVAAYLGVPVVESPEAMQWLSDFLKRPQPEIPESQRLQILIPRGAEALRNPAGTACGFRVRVGETSVLAFPGVPAELDAMARLHLLPGMASDRLLLEKGIWTWGWSEGSQRQALRQIQLPEDFRFSSLPGERGVRISMQCLCAPEARALRQEQLDNLWSGVLAAVPPECLIDPAGADLPQVVFRLLSERKATLAVAESCTGGGLGALITDLPGSSEVFQQGFITYSNQAKTDHLGVDADMIKAHGAVSEATALAMAQGCRERSGCDFAVSITGIAGPDGGTADKPVGTVWIGVASRRASEARLYHFRGDRKAVRSRSCYSALNQLRIFISAYP